MTRYTHSTATNRTSAPENDPVASTTIADFLDAEVTGPETTVTGVDALDGAGADDLAFCTYDDPEHVRTSDAGIVICSPTVGSLPERTLIHAERPKAALVRVDDEFFRPGVAETVVHPTAVVEDGATIGERCRIGAHAYVASCVTIGDDCRVGQGTALGGIGFGFARMDDGELRRQRHTGRVVIENDVEIGANSSIDRAVFDETIVRRGTKLSGNVHLAHQAELGEDTTVAYGSGFSGGVRVGDRVTVHPHVSVATDVVIGDDAEIGMNAAVLDDVTAETTVVGSPAAPIGGHDDD
ncbi:DapH/DapD/GlmU-related protein [Halobellus captivus]|uniref:DapH/DapD/GlmU-related protein n=1 Tax=Halobellus captivus TaxID=2592614 RepID=UPI00119F821F|nr:DapH/DapD/GlmU-related protein [Halobellus captivus]